MLSLYFLGAPRLERVDAKGVPRRIEPDTRKAIALAAYLALTRRAHERDALAAFLYPDADASRARAALRRTLSSLKSALGENALEVERESVALAPHAVRVDVLEFCELANGGMRELERAAELYAGDFLTGFTLRDSPAFDEWQFFETESLRKQFASVLEQLVARLMPARGQSHTATKRAIEYARRWLALDPLHEPAHRALMLLYARDGQRAAALRQYRECVRQLDRELGVAPLPETTALYHAIEENRVMTEPAEAVALTAHAPENSGAGARETAASEPIENSKAKIENQPYPLVGRGRELELLLKTYDAIREDGRLLVIQGEAGIGKTRLAEDFLARVSAMGATALTARGYAEQSALAYAPFVQALQNALQDPRLSGRLAALPPALLADAARLYPSLAPHAVPGMGALAQDGPGNRARFLDAIVQVILTLAGDGTGGAKHAPGVLFVDDAQWLDEASLDLLAFLVRRLKNAPLCILLTWRGEEMPGEHTLRRLYADELRQGRALLLPLARLGEQDVQTLINVAAGRGAPIDPALARRLYRETEGQPFFLIESLKLIEQEGQLPAGDALPAGVRELLHSRLAPLKETAHQLLSAAAVIGRSFDFEILDAVSGRSEQETVEGLEELVSHGLLVERAQAGMPQYDFTHEKLRTLVYEETSLARRRLLHRRAGEAVLARSRAGGEANAAFVNGQTAGQVAYHLRAGGEEERAAEYYKRAGDYARSVFANRDAVENYAAALALGFPDAAALHTGIGDAQTLLGEYDAALASFEAGAAFGAPEADASIARVYLRRGEWERAARHMEDALAAARDSAATVPLHADLAFALHRLDRDAEAGKHARRALQLAQKVKEKDARSLAQAQAHNILGILARTRGEWGAALEHLEASRALAEGRNDAGAHAAALNNLALVYHARNEDERALELAQRALELVTREGDRHRQAAMHNHLSDLYHALGRSAESMEQLKRAVAIYAEIGGPAGAWQPEIWKLEEW